MHYYFCPRCNFRMKAAKHLCPTCGYKIPRKPKQAEPIANSTAQTVNNSFWARLIKWDFSSSSKKSDTASPAS